MKYPKPVFLTLVVSCVLMTLSCKESASNQAANASPTPQQGRSEEEEREWQMPIEKIRVYDIYPTADGGAYVRTGNGRLWYVKEHRAYRVAESNAPISQVRAIEHGGAFAMLSVERQRVRKLKEELDLAESQVEDLKAELKER